MDDLDKFYTVLKEMRNQRTAREQRERNNRKVLGEDIYTLFWVWCQAADRGKDIANTALFGQYLKDNKIELTFWQRKHLAEKYFGCRYEWDKSKGKWRVSRPQ